jgi:hypothetical protein
MRGMPRALAVAAQDGLSLSLVVAALTFGLRHGIDWDHIAAITDITGSQDNARKSLRFATLYALGHAGVVLLLGLIAIEVGSRLPPTVDAVTERLVGTTLLALGIYVFYALLRHGRRFRMQSRWMLFLSAARRVVRAVRRTGASPPVVISHEHEHAHDDPFHATHRHLEAPAASASGNASLSRRLQTTVRSHRHRHRHVGEMPEDPFMQYGTATALTVGVIHGIGAETPTQVLLFVSAVGTGGRAAGTALLIAFIMGLLVSNTLIAIAGAFGFLGASRSFPLYATVAVVTGAFSLVLGILYLLGRGALVPPILGGSQ